GAPRAMMWASVLTTILLFIATAGTIGTFGAKSAAAFDEPLIELTRQTNIPYLLQTFGLAFNPALILQSILAAAWLIWTVADGCGELRARTRPTPWKKNQGFTWAVVLATFILGLLLNRQVYIQQYLRYLDQYGPFFVYGFLALIWLSLLRKGKVNGPCHAS
ncbi:MAG TPA: hypothetical protein VHY08_14780, partial [Bacillota bacterium]|nr:hypothetical protein [Bacillota bacterium]